MIDHFLYLTYLYTRGTSISFDKDFLECIITNKFLLILETSIGSYPKLLLKAESPIVETQIPRIALTSKMICICVIRYFANCCVTILNLESVH